MMSVRKIGGAKAHHNRNETVKPENDLRGHTYFVSVILEVVNQVVDDVLCKRCCSIALPVGTQEVTSLSLFYHVCLTFKP